MQRVVIVGGGYAGVRVAWDLAQALLAGRCPTIEIILVSDQPHHLDTSQLYEVATAYLPRESDQSSERISQGALVPLLEIFAPTPVQVVINSVERIDRAARLLVMADCRTLSYDYVVLAVGAAVATYHTPGVTEHAFILKTLSEALRLRHHMIRQFYAARHLPPRAAAAALTFVIVGGGATGVETAAEWAHHVRKQCRKMKISPGQTRIVLAEASEHILREAPDALRHQTQRRLAEEGVEILTGQPVTRVEADQVCLGSAGESLPANTVIWTAGLAAHPLVVSSQLPLTGFGVTCRPTLQVKGEGRLYAAGDCARLEGQVIPATIPVAYKEGALVARNILHQLAGQPLEEFRYRRQGALVTVGGKRALAYGMGLKGMIGFGPWLIKKLVTLRYWDRYLSWGKALSLWLRGLRVQSLND